MAEGLATDDQTVKLRLASTDVKQGGKKLGVKTVCRKSRPFGQDTDSIVAVQTFLMAGHNAEITDPWV